MEFTALEVTLGGMAVSFLTGLGVRLFFSDHYLTRREFNEYMERMEQQRKDDRSRTEHLDSKLDVLFRMNRAIIQFLPIDDKDKEKILNMRGGC